MSLYKNINARKKAGTSRSKKNSTISPKAYANMKAGFPKKKKARKKKYLKMKVPCPKCGEVLLPKDDMKCKNKICDGYVK